MAKPEAVSTTNTVGTNVSPKETAEISVQTGDRLLVGATMENQVAALTSTLSVSGGSLTWTELAKVSVSEYTYVIVWTAVATSTTSFKVKVTRGGAVEARFVVEAQVWRKSSGIGAVNKTNVLSGAPSLNLTTEKNQSAVGMFIGDWTASTGTAAYRTGPGTYTSKLDLLESGFYRAYGGYYAEVATAGAQTVGMTAPAAQKYSIVAVEIKGEEEEAPPSTTILSMVI